MRYNTIMLNQMPALKNAKHENFAQLYVKSGNASQSYVEAGYNPTTQRALVAASSALRNSPEVAARIDELQERKVVKEIKGTQIAIEKTGLTKEFVINSLILNVRKALQLEHVLDKNGEPTFRYEGSVANRALELLGREMGMFIDRKEVGAPGEFAELDADGLRQAIADRITMVRQGDGSFTVPRREEVDGGEPR